MLTWAQRLRRVFGLEIETFAVCGGKVRVMASVGDPTVIGRILGHPARRDRPAGSRPLPQGPPWRTGLPAGRLSFWEL